MDRVKEILESHLRLAERQFELMRAGTDFSLIEGDGLQIVNATEEDLLARIIKLQEALARHEARNA